MFSCRTTKPVTHTTAEKEKKEKSLIQKISLEIDTLKIDKNIETSYSGNFTIFDNSLVFNDIFFGYLFQFDKNLKILSKNLGFGNQSNELKGADYIIYSDITSKIYVLSSKKGMITVINSKFQSGKRKNN